MLRLRVACELGVERLVGSVRLPEQEVRQAAPPAVREGRLVDHRRAGSHRLFGRAGGRVEPIVKLDRGHVAKLGEDGLLMLDALPPNQVSVRVDPVRLGKLTARDGHLLRGEVRAGEKRRQIGRRERQATIAKLHSTSIAC